jgi:hypothetical protein
MTVLVRGSTLSFSATCLDPTGAPVTPNSANLYISYIRLTDGVRTKATVTMTVAGNVVSAVWDSSVAKDGSVHYSIRALGTNNIVQDGEITLTANEANPSS